jgi:formylglycine-generating enzyme required for sulfatase activity
VVIVHRVRITSTARLLLAAGVLAACSSDQAVPTPAPVAPVEQAADLLPTATSQALTGVTSNSAWTPRVATFDGVEMVLVPPGCFMMGDTAGRSDELPVTLTCIDHPFYLDRYEVTNGQFELHHGQAQEASQWTDPDQPRQRLTWFEARNYCQQRGEHTRLPTEAEWEYAARGPDSLIYPWGNELALNAVYLDTTQGHTVPVGNYPLDRSWVGAYDMAGNVREWVSTIYSIYLHYPYTSADGREDPADTTSHRVMRGGGFLDGWGGVRAAIRNGVYPSYSNTDYGVRCARDVTGDEYAPGP